MVWLRSVAPSIPLGARCEQGSCVTGHACSGRRPPLSRKGTRDVPANDSRSQNARCPWGPTLVLLLPLPVPSYKWRPLFEVAGQAPGVQLHPAHFLSAARVSGGPCPAPLPSMLKGRPPGEMLRAPRPRRPQSLPSPPLSGMQLILLQAILPPLHPGERGGLP